MRGLALSTAIVVACSAAVTDTPTVTPAPTEQASPTPRPLPPVRARSVAQVGGAIAASGDFRGTGTTQVALIRDPANDRTLHITVGDTAPTVADGSTWLKSEASFFWLARAKFAVADVDFDGKDDLVALYDGGANVARLYVFRSTGSSFVFADAWWTAQDYSWGRARNILSGRFSSGGRDTLIVTYQHDDARLAMHAFESDGKALALARTVYDSGPGQFDVSRARFAVGRFTRSGTDQVAAFYQSSARPRLLVFDPGAEALVLDRDVHTADVELDLRRSTIAAADVTLDGRDDVLALAVDGDGGGRVYVFDSGSGFQTSSTTGWASLPGGALCANSGAMVVGDADRDGRPDAIALAPGSAATVATHLFTNGGKTATLTSTPEELRCPVWPLTGLPLNGGAVTKRPLYVKIDNNPTARPHYGISQADQVYEWLVEGLTTRLAAVFHSRQPDVIGSVRSVRMTDRPILPSLGAALVYSGGGPEELMALHYDDAIGHRYIDLRPGFGWGYRVGFRPSPYNYFTTYAALQQALAAAPDGDQPAIVAPWSFLPTATGDPLAGGLAASAEATSITIPYRALFGVRYQYDAASRTYARFNEGVREVDAATGEAIAARNVVVIKTEVHFTSEFGLDPAGNPKLDMQLTGSGTGILFRDGRRQEVTWTRPDVIDAFSLRNEAGEVVLLSPGQTWIQVVPADWSIPSAP